MARIPARTVTPNAGVYLGKVTRVVGAVCYVEVPRLARGFEYGPSRYPSEYGPDEDTLEAGAHSHAAPGGGTSTNGEHVHQGRALAAGDEVAVAFLEGGRDDVVVLVRLT